MVLLIFIFDIIYLTVNCIVFQVQWDEHSSIVRPDRVSPWELEPLVANSPPSSQPTPRSKRARPAVLPSQTPDFPVLGTKVF